MKDRSARIAKYLREIARKEGGLDAIEAPQPEKVLERISAASPLESLDGPSDDHVAAAEATAKVTSAALDKVKGSPAPSLAPEEMFALEAIILPDKRPAVDIVKGEFHVDHALWLDLNDGPIHARLVAAMPSIGRIDLPGQNRIPYGGTGFLVGPGLMMTNRHVAEIFAAGLGAGTIRFRPGWQAAVDLLHERGRSDAKMLRVRGVRMIHPYWDMALLEVEGEGLGDGLVLSVDDAATLDERRVAVVGYPAYDPERNDVAVQNQLFDRTYGVKRLQPGRLGEPREVASFGKTVPAATHDCSTLGGNSGSAVIDLDSGEVLALHFGGRYLDTNYCVPMAALGRDGRVVDAGANFNGKAAGGTPPWSGYWSQTEGAEAGAPAPAAGVAAKPQTSPAALPASAAAAFQGGAITFNVPLTITVQLGMPGGAATEAVALAEGVAGIEEKPVWHDPDYAGRDGYQADFLDGVTVEMPKAADPSVIAPLVDGGDTLHYRHFSVQMHRGRRLALFTASNVTAEAKLKKPEPGRDYSRAGLSGLGASGGAEQWFPDPRIDAAYQLSDRFYSRDQGAFDKGHIVRREDVAWGRSYDELRQGNGDTYHITNCSPQVAQFNQSQKGEDNWGDLENVVLGQAASERFCLFAGPILADDDQIFVGSGGDGKALRVKVPQAFWKVVVARTTDGVAAYAFVLDQDLSNVPLELVVGENFRRRMVSIEALEQRIGLRFADIVRDNDQFAREAGRELAFQTGIERVASIDEEPDRASPNGGDDEAAAAEAGSPASGPEITEAPRPWRVAEALKALRAQVDARHPGRSKAWDGSIGDAAHQSRASDHNPWVTDGGSGVVTAMDITHDPAHGCDAGKLAETIRASADKRVKYIIWNRRIANREPIGGAAAWAWRPYKGPSPHDHHVHISVRPEKQYYDLKDPWSI